MRDTQDKIKTNQQFYIILSPILDFDRDRRDRMVVGFTTTYAISVYHH